MQKLISFWRYTHKKVTPEKVKPVTNEKETSLLRMSSTQRWLYFFEGLIKG